MAMDLRQIEAEILKLDLQARAWLASRLLASLDCPTDSECEQLWAEEALRRHDEIEAGAAVPRDAEYVLRDARSELP